MSLRIGLPFIYLFIWGGDSSYTPVDLVPWALFFFYSPQRSDSGKLSTLLESFRAPGRPLLSLIIRLLNIRRPPNQIFFLLPFLPLKVTVPARPTN